VLLDTDVFSFLYKASTQAALYAQHVKGKTIALSFVTVGELLLWSKTRNWGAARIADLERRIALTGVIPYDMDLKSRIKTIGSPVPDNDLWIAATAIRHSIPLISHNRRNYDEIPGLIFISEAPQVLKGQIEIEDSNP
jgi:tRNA(fMet)-specific endonuclease VapC